MIGATASGRSSTRLIPASSNAGRGARRSSVTAISTSSPPAPLDLWETRPVLAGDPRRLAVRARRRRRQGPALGVATRRARPRARRSLPVNVRFCCDGEEEIGGTSIVDFLDQHAGDADACVIFDAAMLDAETPVFYISARGTLYLHLEVRAGQRDLHSGRLRRRGAERAPHPRRRRSNGPARGRPAARGAADRRRRRQRRRGARLERRCRTGQACWPGRARSRQTERGRRVLPPHLGASVDRRQRDRGRLTGPAEDDRRLVGAGESLDAARPRADRGAH